MESDIRKIRMICDRYFEGEASEEEMKILKSYFTQSHDIPEDLKAVRIMICGLEQASAVTYSPSARRRLSLFRPMMFGGIAAAAAAVACFVILNREVYGYDADGKAITDPQTALQGTECLAYLDKLEMTFDIAAILTEEMEYNTTDR